jgi:hypothetical protein
MLLTDASVTAKDQPTCRASGRRILVIGPVQPDAGAGVDMSDIVIHTRFTHLSAAMLATIQPDLVVAPLFTTGWDIMDLAEALQSGGYAGPVRILSRPLPRSDLVLGEVRALFPGLELQHRAMAKGPC